MAYSELGKYHKALELLKTAEKKFPDSFEVLYYLGENCREIEEYEEAEKYLLKSYEITPEERKLSRSECLNELGVVYWDMHHREDALEQWKLALMENPKNIPAIENLRNFTNKYGEPTSISPLMDDIFHFQKIQFDKYNMGKAQLEFKSIEEADKIVNLISHVWNKVVAPQQEKLDTMTPTQITRWFKSITINFDETKIVKIKKKSKERKKDDVELHRLNHKFSFLPEDGISLVFLVSAFLDEAGLSNERFAKIMDNVRPTKEEKELLIWAYDLGETLVKSFNVGDEEESEDLLDEAMDIAAEYIDEEQFQNAIQVTYATIRSALNGNQKGSKS
ncbi:MAG: tetratricopeptide repeat protein [bacterium]